MPRIFFTGARLADGDGSSRTGKTVVVEGDRIAQVIDDVAAAPVEGDEIYALSGRTLMPGMVIGHYHASYHDVGPGSLPVGMEAPPALQTLRAAYNLGLTLNAGFTGVVSAGAPYAIDASCKLAIAQGLMKGPRIVAGSRDVGTTGHVQDNIHRWYWNDGMGPSTNIVDGVDAFRRAVREEAKRGAEIVKIFASTGHGLNASYTLEMTEEELATAIDTAHQRGMRARAHITRKEAILLAVGLGLDVVDHGDGLDQDCVDLMVEKGTFLAPSLYFPYRITQESPGSWGAMQEELNEMLAILPSANQQGLKIVLGDDYGALPLQHGDYPGELEFYVKVAGIPAVDVIRWATANGADLLGMSGELGFIREGYLADLLVIDGDPLADISVLKDPDRMLAVMKGGEFAKSLLARSEVHADTEGASAPSHRTSVAA